VELVVIVVVIVVVIIVLVAFGCGVDVSQSVVLTVVPAVVVLRVYKVLLLIF